MEVRTEPAPSGWRAPSTTPQNLRAVPRTTDDIQAITVYWDPPIDDPRRELEIWVREYGAPDAPPIARRELSIEDVTDVNGQVPRGWSSPD